MGMPRVANRQAAQDALDLPDPRREPTVPVERAGALLGISRGSAYEAVRRGEIPSIRLGHRVVVPTASLLAMLGVDVGK
jgi:excisionase family DNA binding protein